MMEEAPYWTWTKRKPTLQSHSPPSMGSLNNSWEEKAFAEDSSGALGGCIWPPRSYSCNFCNREFRSAQALGGHMNVHRRDRARLKQSLSPLNEALHHQNPDKSLVSHFSNELGKSHGDVDPKPCRVSDSSIPENSSDNTLASAYASPIARSCSDPKAVRLLRISESKPEGEKGLRGESLCLDHDDYFETGLSVGMNSFVGGDRPPGFSGDDAVSCKRPKTASSSLSFFLKVRSDDTYHLQPEVIGVLKPNTVEDLDLELRLGDPPKVK